MYSNAGQDILQNLLYDGLIEELVDVLGVTDPRLTVSNNFTLLKITATVVNCVHYKTTGSALTLALPGYKGGSTAHAHSYNTPGADTAHQRNYRRNGNVFLSRLLPFPIQILRTCNDRLDFTSPVRN